MPTYATIMVITMLGGAEFHAIWPSQHWCDLNIEIVYDPAQHIAVQCLNSGQPTYVPPPKGRPW